MSVADRIVRQAAQEKVGQVRLSHYQDPSGKEGVGKTASKISVLNKERKERLLGKERHKGQ